MWRDGKKSGFVRFDHEKTDSLMKTLSKKSYDLPKGLRSNVMLVPRPSNQTFDAKEVVSHKNRQKKSQHKIHGHHKYRRLQNAGNDFYVSDTSFPDDTKTSEIESACNDIMCLKFPTLEDFIQIRHVERKAFDRVPMIFEDSSEGGQIDQNDDWTLV